MPRAARDSPGFAEKRSRDRSWAGVGWSGMLLWVRVLVVIALLVMLGAAAVYTVTDPGFNDGPSRELAP
jgi:hypothetical protein